MTDLPAYAPSGLTHEFDPTASTYNLRGPNSRNRRRGLGKLGAVSSTANFDAVFIGDSLLSGYDGGGYTQETGSVPRQAGNGLAAALGLPIAGTGIVPVISAPGAFSDRWTYSGTIDLVNYTGVGLMYAGSTITYTSLIAGTVARVYYGDNASSFTYQVDGGSPITVTAGGTFALKVASTTGLANTTHVIKITAPVNYGNIYAVEITGGVAAGINIHNLSLGSSTCEVGGTVNWNDTTNGFYALGAARRALVPLAGVDPHLVVCSVGGNDIITAGSTVSGIVAGITAMRAYWPNADFWLVNNYTATGGTNVAAYLAARYTLMDTMNTTLVDWQDKIGDLSTAVANGDIGPDGVHPKLATSAAFGRSLGRTMAA